MSAYISAELRHRVRERFNSCCAYCHSAEQLTVATFELEHITPASAGGPTTLENLCLACPACNRRKSNRTSGVDPDSGHSFALFHPHQNQWPEHFVWSADGSRIEALTATARATIAALGMNRPQLVRTRRLWVALGEHPPPFDR